MPLGDAEEEDELDVAAELDEGDSKDKARVDDNEGGGFLEGKIEGGAEMVAESLHLVEFSADDKEGMVDEEWKEGD